MATHLGLNQARAGDMHARTHIHGRRLPSKLQKVLCGELGGVSLSISSIRVAARTCVCKDSPFVCVGVRVCVRV